MRITLHEVSKGRDGQALPSTTLEFHSGEVRFALAETEQRPTVLGLVASGRMRPDSGYVTLDGDRKAKELRRRVALVDAPDVSDPHPDISLAGVVGEELMFAGLGATPLHAKRWLSQLGYAELGSTPIGSIDPAARVRILCELAVLRDGTDAVVLVSPDRHGGSPDGWWRIAREFAERGYAMLVIVGGSAAVALERMRELGAVNASGPVERLVLGHAPAEADASREESAPGSGADDMALAEAQDARAADAGATDADARNAEGTDAQDAARDARNADAQDATEADAQAPNATDTDAHAQDATDADDATDTDAQDADAADREATDAAVRADAPDVAPDGPSPHAATNGSVDADPPAPDTPTGDATAPDAPDAPDAPEGTASTPTTPDPRNGAAS